MLPPCDGPKLHAFSKRAVDIQFVRLLSDNEQDGQSHVFEVIIDGIRYALKVVNTISSSCLGYIRLMPSQFKFYDVGTATFSMSEEEIKKVPIKTIRFQTDPFYNECRAYGRFIECGVDGKIAVRCYGHVAIPAGREEELARRFEVEAWDRPKDDSKLPVSKRQPFRAIVKDLIENDQPLNEKKLITMRKDLLKMHRLGVYPQDVRDRNYGGGLLLDFSIAITKPYWVFELKRSWWIRTLRNDDLTMLQVIMLESGVKTWQRAVRNREYCMKLRGCPDGKERKRTNRKYVSR